MVQQAWSPNDPAQAAAAERMRSKLRAVGDAPDVQYEGSPNDLAAAQRRSPTGPPEARYEEVELDGQTTFVTLRSKDGQEWEAVILPLTMERIEMFSWHQNNTEVLHNRMLNTSGEDAKGLASAVRRSSAAKRALIMYIVKDFPAERFPTMLASSYMKLVKLTEEMKKQALGEGDGAGDGEGDANP